MSDFIFVLDSDGRITSSKVAVDLAVNHDAGQLVGQHYSMFYPERVRSAVAAEQALHSAAREGRFDGQVQLVRADGSLYQGAVSIEPLLAGPEQRAGFLMLVQEGHAQRQRGSEAATSLSRQLISKSAHDLNNTLQVLKSGIDLLHRFGQAGSDGRTVVDMMKRNVEQAASLMQQLLAQVGQGTGHHLPAGNGTAAPTENGGDSDRKLDGLRVFVAEDESLIGMFMEDLLDQIGCRMVGLATSVEQALDAVSRVEMDCLLLDINLQGETSYAVAQALQTKGIPFVFMSGQQKATDEWADRPLVQKPFELEQLQQALSRALGLK